MSYMKREWERQYMNKEEHRCSLCDSSFYEILDLINHMKEAHPSVANAKRLRL